MACEECGGAYIYAVLVKSSKRTDRYAWSSLIQLRYSFFFFSLRSVEGTRNEHVAILKE